MQSTNKTAYIGLGIASVACAVVLVVYAWAYTRVDRIRAEATEAVARATQKGQSEGVASDNRSLLKKHNKDIEVINSYFLHEEGIAPFTERIESLGGIVGVTLTLDTLEQVSLPGNTKGLTLHVRSVGSFEQGMRLLKLFENFPAKFEFSTASLKREVSDGKESQTPRWDFEANIVMLNFINN